ncbi:hypothetical protein BC938DRAFT_472369 [Jimgerdemannia flammicorona]|uniref:Peptidase C14 caspase domain-containing protein n=1 Tax=Jimgerdemannia flammicorona TaxID=994334 RepID=A0A433Q694_9FUNG|nr:hypothetical protein BC938DRAFT_472369 [Jimgerdemannia flammicorona]
MSSVEKNKLDSFTKGYALLIGTGTDATGKIARKFQSTINDAHWLEYVLTDRSRCAYPKNQVTTLTGENATQEAIYEAIDSLAERMGPDSTFIFFYSGHGILMPTSANGPTSIVPFVPEGQDILSSTISWTDLCSHIQKLSTRKCILLLNCCYAGGVVPSLLSDHGGHVLELGNMHLDKDQIQQLGKGKGLAVLSSSRSNQRSYTGYRGGRWGSSLGKRYSVFVAGICEALSGAEQTEDEGYVTIFDLATYCQTYVRKRTDHKQIPYFDFADLDKFGLAYYHRSHLSEIALGGDFVVPEEGMDELIIVPQYTYSMAVFVLVILLGYLLHFWLSKVSATTILTQVPESPTKAPEFGIEKVVTHAAHRFCDPNRYVSPGLDTEIVNLLCGR